MERVPVIKAPLYTPSLEEVANVLQSGLSEEFTEVSVTVVDCPDLTCSPYLLASKGICGKPRVVDIGGASYLLPLPNMEKIYDLSHVPSWSELTSTTTLLIGAGGGPSHIIGTLSEMIPNVAVDASGTTHNLTRICTVDDETKQYVLQPLTSTCESCHLTNLYVSEGKPGKVLQVKVREKKQPKGNFILCMHEALRRQYNTQPVGLGGVFVLVNGKARVHVMPYYSEVPLTSSDMIDKWLNFYNMSAPLTCVGYLMSYDPGLNLRMEHFHCFSEHGDGGHFHYDVTPTEAEYVGYFNIAQYMFRVDNYPSDA